MPATRGMRIWGWLSLFPAVFYFTMMFLYWAFELGFAVAFGIVGAACLAGAIIVVVRRR